MMKIRMIHTCMIKACMEEEDEDRHSEGISPW
jgi:hypothetical protein